jgi:dipeptidyl-peptidase-4
MVRDRHHRRVGVLRIDATTGKARPVFEETSPTFVSLNGGYYGGLAITHRVIDRGRQILWFSERGGWGHLYRYDLATGKLLNQVTSGQWVVTGIVDVDEEKGIVYFLGAGRENGRNPYLNSLYRVNLDGSRLKLLTPEDGDHEVFAATAPERSGLPASSALSPSKAYFVDRYSRVDTVPVSVLRSAETGKVLMTIEQADHAPLGEGGWTRPIPFVVKARDGATDLFGTMYLPADFDRAKKYPVIDNVYPGAHFIVPDVRAFSPRYFYRQALANLGFIVVNLDGLGTTGRGKAFHDLSYGNLQDGPGLPDHVAGIRELARHYPQIDLDRVGVFGHSSGGYGTVLAMLKFPDFFKVGVASAAAVDMCGAIPLMMDKWQGPPKPGTDYCEPVFLANMAPNLKGKLLIAYGEMDEHMPAATATRLIDALTKANRDYDLVVMPNRAHGFSQDRYFSRRLFDYFVRHLLGSEPPVNASLADPE